MGARETKAAEAPKQMTLDEIITGVNKVNETITSASYPDNLSGFIKRELKITLQDLGWNKDAIDQIIRKQLEQQKCTEDGCEFKSEFISIDFSSIICEVHYNDENPNKYFSHVKYPERIREKLVDLEDFFISLQVTKVYLTKLLEEEAVLKNELEYVTSTSKLIDTHMTNFLRSLDKMRDAHCIHLKVAELLQQLKKVKDELLGKVAVDALNLHTKDLTKSLRSLYLKDEGPEETKDLESQNTFNGTYDMVIFSTQSKSKCEEISKKSELIQEKLKNSASLLTELAAHLGNMKIIEDEKDPKEQGLQTETSTFDYGIEYIRSLFKDGVMRLPDKRFLDLYLDIDEEKYSDLFVIFYEHRGFKFNPPCPVNLKIRTGVDSEGNSFVYIGQVINGEMAGLGMKIHSHGLFSMGEFSYGALEGECKWLSCNGERYDGTCSNGKPHGHGAIATPDGDIYEGQWMSGKQVGIHACYYADGDEGQVNFD